MLLRLHLVAEAEGGVDLLEHHKPARVGGLVSRCFCGYSWVHLALHMQMRLRA